MRFSIFILTVLLPLRFFGQVIEGGDSSVVGQISQELRQLYGTQDTTLHFLTNKKLLKINVFGTELSVEWKGKAISRIVFSAQTTEGVFSGEYFFYEGKLIFVYQTFEYFDEIPTKTRFTNFKGIKGWESRFYFRNEELAYQKTLGLKARSLSYSADDLRKEKNRLLDFIKSRYGK